MSEILAKLLNNVPDHQYQVTIICRNCDLEQVLVAPRGTLVGSALMKQACLECGCVGELRKRTASHVTASELL